MNIISTALKLPPARSDQLKSVLTLALLGSSSYGLSTHRYSYNRVRVEVLERGKKSACVSGTLTEVVRPRESERLPKGLPNAYTHPH